MDFTVNNAEENRANLCKFLDGKQLFSALYGMYTVTLNELKVVFKVSAQAGQTDEVESTARDGLHEVKRCKRYISIDTSQKTKRSTT
jgi:hypothetical protein